MKLFLISASVIAGFLVILSGCSLDPGSTQTPPASPSGSDLVISEVYKISPEQYYAFSWIELYNPTDRVMKWYSRTQVDSVTILTERLVLRFRARVRFYDPSNPSFIYLVDTSYIYFSNTFDRVFSVDPETYFDPAYFDEDHTEIDPGRFVIVVNDKKSFDEHFIRGPFSPPVLEQLIEFGNFKFTTILVRANEYPFAPLTDSTKFLPIPAYWDLLDRDEISLIRISDTLRSGVLTEGRTYLDVVRYGGFRPTFDMFPGNQPAGDIPEGSSLARFSAYYSTGNTADEFYVSPDPIPGWHSQRGKQ